jgi:hypothetical protein
MFGIIRASEENTRMLIHLEVVTGTDLYVRVFDVIAQAEVLPRTLETQGVPFVVDVAEDGTGRGHIKWDSVTEKDAGGNCRWGNGDVIVDDSDVYYITATSNAPGYLACL